MDPSEGDIWLNPDDIDPDVRKRAWELIEAKFEKIIDGFYRSVLASEHGRLLANQDVVALKAKQKVHWRNLFLQAEADNRAYYLRLERMYARHREIGLDNTSYISAYIFLLGSFHRAVLKGSAGPKEAHQLIVAVNTIVASDINRAMEVQHETLLID